MGPIGVPVRCASDGARQTGLRTTIKRMWRRPDAISTDRGKPQLPNEILYVPAVMRFA